jgi:hypothetical protein
LTDIREVFPTRKATEAECDLGQRGNTPTISRRTRPSRAAVGFAATTWQCSSSQTAAKEA